jgi:probable rRNA maturation factor
MINIQIENEGIHHFQIDNEVLTHCCRTIFEDYRHENGELTFIFTGDEVVRKLKHEYFKEDVYTDIITFNLEDDGDSIEGEVYISWKRAKENAKKFDQQFETELKRLVIHGTLHLLGLDDITEDDKKEMTRLEEHYLKQISGEIITHHG